MGRTRTDVLLYARIEHEQGSKSLRGIANHCAAKLDTVVPIESSGVLTYIDASDDQERFFFDAAVQLLKQHLMGSDTTIPVVLDEVEKILYEDPECAEQSALNWSASRS